MGAGEHVDTTQPVRLDGLQPLVVTVQGHTTLVMEFQREMQRLMPAFSLNAVVKKAAIGGEDGVTFIEWWCGFAVTDDDVLKGPGASYVGFAGYSFPTIDLIQVAIQRLKVLALHAHATIKKRAKRRKEAVSAMFREEHAATPTTPPKTQRKAKRTTE